MVYFNGTLLCRKLRKDAAVKIELYLEGSGNKRSHSGPTSLRGGGGVVEECMGTYTGHYPSDEPQNSLKMQNVLT